MNKSVGFKFDPYSTVFLCFHKMFPKKRAEIEWAENLISEDLAWGKTDILSHSLASVSIDTSQSIAGSIDTLIHELAHVGRGFPSNKSTHRKVFVESGGHDKRWTEVYNDLWRNYEKHRLTYLFIFKIGKPKCVSKREVFQLMSAVVDKSFNNQMTKRRRRKKNVPDKTASR